jgi:hypothetical protein
LKEVKVKRTKVTKAELIREIKAKAGKAKPVVRRVFFSGLARNTKPELERKLRRMRVTRSGDIDLR